MDFKSVMPQVEAFLKEAGKEVAELKQTVKATLYFSPITKTSSVAPDFYHEPWILIHKAYDPSDVLVKSSTDFFTAPSPLAAALAGGLLGAGLGYGGGALAEQILPKRHFNRGRLRKTLALLGGGLGAAPGLWLGSIAQRNHPETPDLRAWLSGWPNRKGDELTPGPDPIAPPEVPEDYLNPEYDQPIQRSLFDSVNWNRKQACAAAFELLFDKQVPSYYKEAVQAGWGYGLAELSNVPNIKADEFTQTVWADRFTPVPIRAATTGLVDSASALNRGTRLVSPMDIAKIGIGMGSGYASGLLVGKVLGALAGLKPEAQEVLQRAGTWAGILSNVVPLVF
jgi:hypothetical protein